MVSIGNKSPFVDFSERDMYVIGAIVYSPHKANRHSRQSEVTPVFYFIKSCILIQLKYSIY